MKIEWAPLRRSERVHVLDTAMKRQLSTVELHFDALESLPVGRTTLEHLRPRILIAL